MIDKDVECSTKYKIIVKTLKYIVCYNRLFSTNICNSLYIELCINYKQNMPTRFEHQNSKIKKNRLILIITTV